MGKCYFRLCSDRVFSFLILIVLLNSCERTYESQFNKLDRSHYANGFRFRPTGECMEVVLMRGEQQRIYLLIPRGATGCDTLDKTVIRTPVQRVILSGTTQIPWLEALGVQGSLVGFPDPKLIHTPELSARYRSGGITDVGGSSGMDLEQVLALKPDLVLAYPSTDGIREKLLNSHGITVLVTAEMEEAHPLGRAEWIRLAGMLFGLPGRADSIFTAVSSQYLKFARREKTLPAPTIMTGIPYGGTWFIPGGKNFAATLFKDAGYDYLWSDNGSTGILQLGFEAVYARALKADHWIGVGHFRDRDGMLAYDHRFYDFGPFKSGRIYTYSLDASSAVPNPYFEEAVLRPDLLLQDLILIRECAPDSIFRYYRRLH